jgi:hypothetical protein
VHKIPASKAVEEELDSALTPRKRGAKSPVTTGHDEKRQKAHSAEPSGAKADKAVKGNESVALKGAKAIDPKTKAAEVAKRKAAEAVKTKATKEAEAAVSEKGKDVVISKAPRQGAKEGPGVAMTQSPAVEEVVNEPAPFVVQVGDFGELHT